MNETTNIPSERNTDEAHTTVSNPIYWGSLLAFIAGTLLSIYAIFTEKSAPIHFYQFLGEQFIDTSQIDAIFFWSLIILCFISIKSYLEVIVNSYGSQTNSIINIKSKSVRVVVFSFNTIIIVCVNLALAIYLTYNIMVGTLLAFTISGIIIVLAIIWCILKHSYPKSIFEDVNPLSGLFLHIVMVMSYFPLYLFVREGSERECGIFIVVLAITLGMAFFTEIYRRHWDIFKNDINLFKNSVFTKRDDDYDC